MKSSFLSLLQQGEWQGAEKSALGYLGSGQSDFHAWYVAGMSAVQQGRGFDAIARLEQATELCPSTGADIAPATCFHAHLALSQLYLATGDKKAAEQTIVAALTEFRLLAEFGNDTGNVLAQCERLDEAAQCYRHAIDADCDRPQALNNLANVSVMAGRPEDALGLFRAALQENNGAVDTCSNLAAALDQLAQFDQAGPLHRKALAGDPDNVKFNVNYAMHLLRNGRIEAAIPHYLYRFQSAAWGHELHALQQAAPPGPHDRFTPGTVVVGEQGLGDEIFLLKLLAGLHRPDRWSYVGDPRLAELFSRTFAEAEFLARSANNIDALIHNASNVWRLDHVVGFIAERETLDGSRVMTVDARRVEQWKASLDEIDQRPKIGISWTGGQRRMDRLQREVAPQFWSALAGLGEYTLVDIQYDDRPAERNQIERHLNLPIHRLDGIDLINKLGVSAAVLPALDHVVTVDNSTAHLAGALGVRASVLLPRVPDWRWGLFGTSTAVYPSLKLIRQTKAHDWHAPLVQLLKSFGS